MDSPCLPGFGLDQHANRAPGTTSVPTPDAARPGSNAGDPGDLGPHRRAGPRDGDAPGDETDAPDRGPTGEATPTPRDRAQGGGARRIPIADIAVPEGRRPVSPTWLARIQRSIAAQGLFQPILVRAVAGADRPYELVAGRHRLEACRKLRHAEIEATVADLDDELAEMATISENLWRLPLQKKQFERALAEWEAIYLVRYPETARHTAGGVARARKKSAASRGSTARAEGDTGAIPDTPDEAPAEPFASVVAGTLGVSRRTAERALKRSRTFSDQDREAFEQCGVTSVQQDAIAAIADPARRAECLTRIIQGLDPWDAIGLCQADLDPGVAPARESPEDEDEMTDQQWLETCCGGLRARLKHTARFDNDALLYRMTLDVRRELKTAIQGTLEPSRPGERLPPFLYLTWRVAHVDHPKTWRVCFACEGAGTADGVPSCPRCRGDGYLLAYEGPSPGR